MSLTVSRPRQYADGKDRSADASTRHAQDEARRDDDDALTQQDPEDEPVKKNWRGPKRRSGMSMPVELRLVGAIVIAFKLIYGLDGTPRSPTSRQDPAIGLPLCQEWLREVKAKLESGWFRQHGHLSSADGLFDPVDFTKWGDDEDDEAAIDAFLASAQEFMTSTRTIPSDRINLASCFPLPLNPLMDSQRHSRLEDPTIRAVRGWKAFYDGCNTIQPPPAGAFTDDTTTLPLGARVAIYVKGSSRLRPRTLSGQEQHGNNSHSNTGDNVTLPRDLELLIDASSHLVNLDRLDILIQVSTMETTLFWAQQPFRPKRAESTAWARYRERWEATRRALRDVVEQHEWNDEDDRSGESDLVSWHEDSNGSEVE